MNIETAKEQSKDVARNITTYAMTNGIHSKIALAGAVIYVDVCCMADADNGDKEDIVQTLKLIDGLRDKIQRTIDSME